MRPPCRLARLLAALALTASGVSSVTGCGARADATDVGRDVGQLQSMLLGERFTAGRLAGQTAWSGCAVVDTAALVPRLRCAPPPAPGSRRFAAIGRASRVVLPRLRSDSSPAVLRAAALVDLRWRDTDAAGVDRAIAALERARSRAPDDARVLNDLAVAYLARAERDQQLRPLLQALDAVERARAAGDASPVALFNRALLLERLYLVETARGAWDAYVAAEHDPAWRREGAAHRERLARLAAGSPRTPQTARETGLAALGTWGRAVTLGDSLGARRDLDSARALGAELDAAGADRSVALAVRAIEAAQRTPSRVRTLAAAHAAFADGLALYGRAAYEDAARELGRAERAMREAGTPAARWAAVYRALALLNRGARDSADAVLRRALADATPAEPALVGKILWTLGLNQVRRGSYEAAARLYGDAQPYFARLGETENLGMLSSLRAEALNFAGQAAAGHDEALRGMHLLAPFRASSFMANHISVFGGYARADRVPLAALDVADELLAVARSSGRPQSVAWAYRERARTALAAGRAEVARADLTEAERWMARVPPGVSRDRLAAYVGLVRAQVALAGDPAAARDELEAVVRGYRAARDEINLPNALYQAALAARAVGDTARARAALAEAVAAIESRRALFPSAEVRASYYETTENVYDAMIELSLARGDASEAFELLERSRAAVWAGTARDAPIGVPALRTRLPAGVLVIEYALLRERVIVWAVSRSAWRSISLPVPRDSIAALVARFHAELGDPAATAARARDSSTFSCARSPRS
ncbi:hypothetical protein J421_4748 (plasmid) [Gemmatirosa kalamazoonensis]|uniref:Tetratricopeptide repeat protein n=1 Tax=Gemmatirosa kalamazoonensis TaxID=861299 RepID=W0RRT1_9BACT|nr:hypothetical protein [Gemmatirosa kalamazoonensis]AHG92283.1 hypothetical protein J421_4748 [Gemmatirosa kalamazoonensis]